MRDLIVTHTTTFDGRPLAVVDGLPGGHAELSPAQLRAFAAALLTAATDCDSLPIHRKHGRRAVRIYPLAPQQSAEPSG